MTHELKNLEDLHQQYMIDSLVSQKFSLDWGKWLPSLGEKMRPALRGELIFFLGDTGTGKTAVLQAIAKAANPLPVLFMEMELPGTLAYERFAAMHSGVDCKSIQADYKQSSTHEDLERLRPYFEGLEHIIVCDESRIDETALSEIIEVDYPEKYGHKPVIVIVDYIGLMNSKGAKRYERIAQAAQELKRTAKATNTIIICASQVHRSGEDGNTGEIGLHSARNAGEIEESAGIVFGLMRGDDEDSNLLRVKCLKSTKDGGGHEVRCDFDGKTMRITERTYQTGTTEDWIPPDDDDDDITGPGF